MRDRPPLARGGAPSRRGLLRAVGALSALAATGTLSGCGSVVGQAFTGSAGPDSLLHFWNRYPLQCP